MRALFIHHSVGRQLLQEGELRERARELVPALELWDHDYNEIGLSDGSGRRLGRAFPIPDDDTDPPGLLRFLQGVAGDASYAEEVRAFDVLVVKSCFPTNAIDSEAAASALRETYLHLRELAAELPLRTVLVSSPPLVAESTSGAQRRRARELAAWLAQRWPGERTDFADLFTALAAPSGPFAGSLRLPYRLRRLRDSHPRQAGCHAGAAVVADALGRVAQYAA